MYQRARRGLGQVKIPVVMPEDLAFAGGGIPPEWQTPEHLQALSTAAGLPPTFTEWLNANSGKLLVGAAAFLGLIFVMKAAR